MCLQYQYQYPSPRTGDEVAIIQSRITLVHHSVLIWASLATVFQLIIRVIKSGPEWMIKVQKTVN